MKRITPTTVSLWEGATELLKLAEALSGNDPELGYAMLMHAAEALSEDATERIRERPFSGKGFLDRS